VRYRLILCETYENVVKEDNYTDSTAAWLEAGEMLDRIMDVRSKNKLFNNWKEAKVSMKVEVVG
jgi:hypothetical protein